MNVEHKHQEIDFEWDSDKAAGNFAKHDIAFETACEAFFDPLVLLVDEEVIDDELREHLIGMTANWRVLYVVYVMRDESIRIVSARLAEPHERRKYENQ